jgi:hypothetical protein
MRHRSTGGQDWTAGQPAINEQATTAYPPQEQQSYPPQEQHSYPPQDQQSYPPPQQTYPGHPQAAENAPGSYPTGTTPENPEGYRS